MHIAARRKQHCAAAANVKLESKHDVDTLLLITASISMKQRSISIAAVTQAAIASCS